MTRSTEELERLQGQILRYRIASASLALQPDIVLELLAELIERRRLGHALLLYELGLEEDT